MSSRCAKESGVGLLQLHLQRTFDTSHRLILSYLIPCHLLTTHTLPTTELLALYPRLEALFRPLCTCIKRGDLSGFDAALSLGEHEFVTRRIYLTRTWP